MADEETAVAETQLTFNVKAASDAKHTVTVPSSMTVLDLKQKLSTAEYANIAPERQRLIYSGRVMKDADALSAYKIKDGNTVHLVKSAESTQRANPTAQQAPVAPAVPQNLATGTANDPLAALTGARYAGFHNLPSSDMFGPDGGMTPQNPEDMLRRMEDPAFVSQMNEAMNNPDVIRMLSNAPQFRDNPQALRMLQDPNMRRMLMDPNVIRQSMQMARNMGLGGGASDRGGMPMPGATDTTPAQQQGGTNASSDNTAAGGNQTPFNPFSQLFGGGGAGAAPFGGVGGNMDPFASLFGNPSNSQNRDTNTASDASGANNANNTSQDAGNPFASMAGGPLGGGFNPQMMQAAMEHMRQNPEQARMAMNMLLGGAGAGAGAGTGTDTGDNGQAGGAAGFNPFAALGGFGGLGGAQQPQDSRPPEEQYADQLRQLNDMGFFDFNQNVRALRMSGGRVEGAVEIILSGQGGP